MRIGHGYDAHKLVKGRRLILGGVEIPFEKGLLGHSDADAVVHAVIDSLLGAAGMGDIGGMFPDSDPRYKDADSIKLLKTAFYKILENGYTVGNIDVTIIAQAPKLKEYIGQMRLNIAKACETSIENVNVKATTEEHMGFTGSGEGISAHAVCTII